MMWPFRRKPEPEPDPEIVFATVRNRAQREELDEALRELLQGSLKEKASDDDR